MSRASSTPSSRTASADGAGCRVGRFPAAGLRLALLAVGAEDRLIAGLDEAAGGVAPGLRGARRAGLLPAYARFLGRIGFRAEDSEAARAIALGMLAERRAAACVALLEELAEAAHHSGDPIALKGAALTLGGFYSTGERQMADADLLIPAGAADQWKRAAAGIGARFTPLRAGGYEIACVERGGAIVELHVALAGEAGRLPSLTHADLLPHAVPSPRPGLGIPDPSASREIAVHHFVFHHGGAEEHGLRTLQDLARLPPRSPGDPPLPWPGRSPSRAGDLLGRIVESLRQARWEEDENCRRALAPIFDAIAGSETTSRDFSEDVDEIVLRSAETPFGGTRAVVRYAFPPIAEIRACAGESRARTVVRYPTRALRLAARYAAARATAIFRRRRRRRWREFLASGGDIINSWH